MSNLADPCTGHPRIPRSLATAPRCPASASLQTCRAVEAAPPTMLLLRVAHPRVGSPGGYGNGLIDDPDTGKA